MRSLRTKLRRKSPTRRARKKRQRAKRLRQRKSAKEGGS